MTPLIFLIGFTAFVGAVETFALTMRKKTLAGSSVSSLPETDFRVSPQLRRLSTALAALTIGALLLAWVFGISTLVSFTTVATYATLRLFLETATRAGARRSFALRYARALETKPVKKAEFAVYFTAPYAQDPYHVTMWLDALLSLEKPFVIIATERRHYEKMPRSDKYQVLFAPKITPSTLPLPQKVKAVFYVNNALHNRTLVDAYPQMAHIQLLHGDSDKPPSYNPMSIIYDRLFVAGEMAIDRYERHGVHIPREKFEIVGRPQLAPAKSTAGARKTVVYMPTWAGVFADSNYSSLSQAPTIIRNTVMAGEDFDMIFKPHPISFGAANWPAIKSEIDAIAAQLPQGVTFRLAGAEDDPFALYEAADVLVTDISSTVIDFLHTGKPYIVTNPRNYGAETLAKYPSVSGGYLLQPDAENLTAHLTSAFGTDDKEQTRKALRLYAFGDYGRPQGEAFREACASILDAHPVTQESAIRPRLTELKAAS